MFDFMTDMFGFITLQKYLLIKKTVGISGLKLLPTIKAYRSVGLEVDVFKYRKHRLHTTVQLL